MTTATIAPLNKDFCKAPCKPSQHCWTTTPSIGCGRIRELILVLNQVLRFSVPLGIQNTIEFTLEKCQHWCYTVFFSSVTATIIGCCMHPFADSVACYWELLREV